MLCYCDVEAEAVRSICSSLLKLVTKTRIADINSSRR